MAMQVRIELNTDGIRQFLKTDEGIAKDLQRRVDAVAADAERKMPNAPRSTDSHFSGSVWVGGDRQRGTVRTVSPEAKKAEAQDHVLLSSVDAARSP